MASSDGFPVYRHKQYNSSVGQSIKNIYTGTKNASHVTCLCSVLRVFVVCMGYVVGNPHADATSKRLYHVNFFYQLVNTVLIHAFGEKSPFQAKWL